MLDRLTVLSIEGRYYPHEITFNAILIAGLIKIVIMGLKNRPECASENALQTG